ncbi:hypothetical protein [Marinivivus vitaminiproducens]|uniref:hypothetical protein n=1 Tax=Marinivivus vitaminiproducens TaxID=3035935 RepID=UPI0027AA3E91|nr:hypothetical protein P4R82_04710 [Geminicoccaceae bacterium SCSIO 64248]
MPTFVAIVLICMNTTPPERCNEETAVDVLSITVDNEMGCMTGWQEIVARSTLASHLGKDAYMRTICRRTS